MRQDFELTAFSKGEGSPRLKGRTDYKGYFEMCETMLNMVVLPQGGATRRPGTEYVVNTKGQVKILLRRFIFSTLQAYMLEFGPTYIRVYKNDGQVVNPQNVSGAANNGSGLIRLTVPSTAGMYTNNTAVVASVGGVPAATGTWLITVIDATHIDLQGSAFAGVYTSGGTATVTVEIPTSYQAADLAALQFTQSADTLYIAHPTYPTATLGRSSHTNWTLANIAFLDGPYLPVNATTTTLTPSATSGAVTLTASAITGINNGQGFLSTDVGRLIRLQQTNWCWCIITGFTSSTVVTVTTQANVPNGANGSFDSTAATSAWRLGKFSATTGYPWLPTFWQQRLMLAGTNNQPNAIEASNTANFVSFAPTKVDGTVLDTNALSWVISDDQVNAARWISAAGSAQSMQLGIGTDGSEEILQAATTAQALTPVSVQAYRETAYGSVANSEALRIGKSVLFVNFSGRKVYDWAFSWQVNGYIAVDRTVDSEHITRALLLDIAYQKNPYGVVWGILADGSLIGMTYLPEQNVIAWHRHRLGGQYYGGPPIVESIDCIPSADGTYDELWLSVLRTVAGVPTRTIEVMTRFFDALPLEQSWFVDCALQSSLTLPAAICTPSAMGAGTITFAASAGVFSPGTAVGSLIRINNGIALVQGFTDTSHVTGIWWSQPTNLAPAASGAWSCTPALTTFSGMSYLAGETVQLLGDGADFGTQTAAVSTVLPNAGTATFVTIGLPSTYDLVSMPMEPLRAAAITSQGKAKNVDTLYLRLHETLGCTYGMKRTDPMTDAVDHPGDVLQTRSAADPLGRPPPLYSGIKRLKKPGGYDYEQQLEITGAGPYPCTVLALVAKGDVGELVPR